jgi:hypothetical protein
MPTEAAPPAIAGQAPLGATLTHKELCQRARRWLVGPGRCPVALVEFVTSASEIPDAIGFRNSGRDSLLIECKTSRSDFLRDAQKRHRQEGHVALGSYRYFMCEPHLIRPDELPGGWGLLWVTARRIELLAGADPAKCYWPADSDVWRWATGENERKLMFSALLRLKASLGSARFQESVQQVYAKNARSFARSEIDE